MTILINGRTSEEIKLALKVCNEDDCLPCPYEMGYICSDYMMRDALALIEHLEAKQLNQIVHCKDCAHWKPCEVKGFEGKMYCEWAGWLVGENAYCVYGEVKDNASDPT